MTAVVVERRSDGTWTIARWWRRTVPALGALAACAGASAPSPPPEPRAAVARPTPATPTPRDLAPAPAPPAPAIAVQRIALAGVAAERAREFSGLAWHGDDLLLLPQFPHRVSAAGPTQLFRIARARLLAFIDGRDTAPIEPAPVVLRGAEALTSLPGCEGFEAIAVDGERVYLAVETRADDHMAGLLVPGVFEPGGGAIQLDASRQRALVVPVELPNMAFEALTITPQGPLVMYEANGVVARTRPAFALLFDRDLSAEPRRVAFPPLPYRVTDATAPDARGRFWVSNYFYPGDLFLLSSPAAPATDAGPVASVPPQRPVERLVELELTREGVRETARPPLYLQLETTPAARNWEGIVRLDARGFLLVTDLHPTTILAFVPFAQ